MKKIVSIVLFMIAFGFSSNAQTKSLTTQSETKSKDAYNKDEAYKDISDLTSIITISPELKNDFMNLMIMRNDAVLNSNTLEEKKAVFERYGQKFLAGLTEEQRNTLMSKPELYKRLTTYSQK